MKLARVVEDYVTLKRSTGLRFTNAATILKAFARAAGPIDVNEVAQETVQTFLHGSLRQAEAGLDDGGVDLRVRRDFRPGLSRA